MNTDINLVTSCEFRGREYVVSLRTVKQPETIEVKVTDKKTSEEWIGSYIASYIENLTLKTGNYKRFDTFISMLKSALLSTSHCVTLDLLKFEDLEMLRSRSTQPRSFSVHTTQILASSTNNRRYLMVTYTVEFDRIHYPLALEYCGPPDPRVLQETIERLEKQVAELQFQLVNNDYANIKSEIDALQKRVVNITTENVSLKEQIKKLTSLKINKDCHKEIYALQNHINELEDKLHFEKSVVDKLKKDNILLASQLEDIIRSENHLQDPINRSRITNVNPLYQLYTKKSNMISPKRKCRTMSCAEKPFNRSRPVSKERKAHSARSFRDVTCSSSDESALGRAKRERLKRPFTPTRNRASSPSFSDLSHNSELSRCACKNCLHDKFSKKDETFNYRFKGKTGERAKLLKRIQSLEKLISGIVLN
ncbi:centrosomal protein CCDC61-like [Macrosteles quadrilineatus]|uniref:centrosomal protein CCDC61-like n=1 Tax=Macrosteles quadrilineatus TaxID=74068 RepID=UPI0023E1D229|nr:centrosomal protein CCDC61-like [Macrosteles quadrilineatus]